MFNTTPVQLDDGWPIASPQDAYLDPQDLSDLTRWIEETYVYQNTHAVLIAHAGHLVYELYLEGPDQASYGPREHRKFDVDSLHDLQSISKSVTSLLLGIAFAGDYDAALATPVTEFFKGQGFTFGAGAETVTLQHLLTMTAGYQWDEYTWPYSDPRNSNRRLSDAEDPLKMMLGLPLEHPPGTFWQYNNGVTEILAAILEVKTGQGIDEYAEEKLFQPLGITRFEWLGPSTWLPQGRPSAAGGLRLSARDLTKIGQLFLNKGVWDNNQIISRKWIEMSGQYHVAESYGGDRGVYGYGFQWWPGHSNSIPRYPITAGFGHGGQQLLIVAERHLVVTVFAGNYGRHRHSLFNWVLDRIVFAHRNH